MNCGYSLFSHDNFPMIICDFNVTYIATFRAESHAHRLLIWILDCPVQSCVSASNLFDGGRRKFSIRAVASNCAKRVAAHLRISDGKRRDLPVK